MAIIFAPLWMSRVPVAQRSVNRHRLLTMIHLPLVSVHAQWAHDHPLQLAMIVAALIAALAISAKGEIYRCVDAQGNIGFHDLPCKDKPGVLIGKQSDSVNADLRKLRESLSKLEQARPVERRAPAPLRPALPAQLSWIDRGPANERALAACSSQFFHCAEGNAPRMDRCVASMPRCSNARHSNCCPQDCISRYGDLRRSGSPPAASVRNALLDDRHGSCTAR